MSDHAIENNQPSHRHFLVGYMARTNGENEFRSFHYKIKNFKGITLPVSGSIATEAQFELGYKPDGIVILSVSELSEEDAKSFFGKDFKK